MALITKEYDITPTQSLLALVQAEVDNETYQFPPITLRINDGSDKQIVFDQGWMASDSKEYATLAPLFAAESTTVTGLQLTRRGAIASSDPITILGVQTVPPTTTTVIVPEQTVTTEKSLVGDAFWAELANADASYFESLQDGDSVPFVVNGTTYNGTVAVHDGGVAVGDEESFLSIHYIRQAIPDFLGAGIYLFTGSGGTYTVSMAIITPKTETKWEVFGMPQLPSSDGLYYLKIDGGVATWEDRNSART